MKKRFLFFSAIIIIMICLSQFATDYNSVQFNNIDDENIKTTNSTNENSFRAAPRFHSSSLKENHTESSFILYRFRGKILKDSKWGAIANFQRALSEQLRRCGKEGLKVDGIFGEITQQKLMEILSCPGFEDFTNHPLLGTVHSELWKKIIPDSPIPNVHERAFALLLSHEGTDYDRVEWNYGTDDDRSALTWGPYGATVGWGNEVRGILKMIHDHNPELLRNIFSTDFRIIEKLIDSQPEEGYQILKVVFENNETRQSWKKKLQNLGKTEECRKFYDLYAFQTNKWLRPNFRKLYKLIPDAASNSTEIDYAFFLDIGAHTSVSSDRIEGTISAIKSEEDKLGRSLQNFECRRVIGQFFAQQVNQRWKHDRMGRNVVFYVDGYGDTLSTEELNAWTTRTGRKASSYGLSDERIYYPKFLEE